MKPLILSFFLIILAYSLLVDNKKDTDIRIPRSISTMQTDMPDAIQNTDSVIFYAGKSVKPVQDYAF